jgi:hypothetical protein
MYEIKFPKGSEWRKWDLHFHCQSSFDYEDKSITDEEIITELVAQEIEAVVITDHHKIDEARIRNLQKIGDGKVAVLPGIEFRSELGGSELMHFIGIFAENSDISYIWKQLQVRCKIDDADIERRGGYERTFCDFKETAIIIHELGGLVSVHAGKKSNSLERLKNDIKDDLEVNNCIDILEVSRETDIAAYHEIVFPNIKRTIPIVLCSDNHNIKQYKTQQNLWIKSDPTFEGLKQIIYEPKERVQIQKLNPALDFEKPFFSNIHISENELIFDDDDLIFCKCENGIPLNQNLVAIIGGRGEGKSMLTDFIASSFVGQTHSKEGNFRKDGNLSIEYYKTNQKHDEKISFTLNRDRHAVEFIYINQGHLKYIVEQKDKQSNLANSIRKLAKLSEPKFSEELNQKTLQDIKDFQDLSDFFEVTDDEENLINSLDYLQKQEMSINEFISNITTEENRDKLARYTSNLAQINDLNVKREELLKFENDLKQVIRDLNLKITTINNESDKIPEFAENLFDVQISAIRSWIEEIGESISTISEATETVKEEFKTYKGDLTTLLNDIDKFQNSLFAIRKKIKDVEEKINTNKTLKESIFVDIEDADCLITQTLNDYQNQQKKLEKEWEEFTKIDERSDLNAAQKDIMNKLLNDLSIEVTIFFDEDSFYEETTNSINGAVWRVKNNKQAQKDWFRITDIKSFFDFISNKYLTAYRDNSFYRDPFTKIFFDETVRRKFIKVFPILKYQGKNLNKISVGQKGTVYLKMKLATEAFSKPIIFDQPEDDLDNEFIMDDLIDLFKNLKKYRQVIIITHNANLVVNADAEQVIIAKNDKGQLHYSSGSLENQTINDNICRILEGGRTAFEKRRDKYNYPK